MYTEKIKIIGFDLDQTLYPKSPDIDLAIQQYLYRQISELHQVDLKKAEEMFADLYQNGRGLSGSKTLMKLGFQEDNAKNLVQEALEKADIAKFLKPNKDTIELLNYIKKKYTYLDIITGSNRKNTELKLEKMEIPTNLFSHILTADEVSKSDFTAYKKWLLLYPGYIPENFLYVGDRVSSDFEKPNELGILSILVNIKKPDSNIPCLQLPSLSEIKDYI